MRYYWVLVVSLAFLSFKLDRQEWLFVIHAEESKLTEEGLELIGLSDLGAAFSAGKDRETRSFIAEDLMEVKI